MFLDFSLSVCLVVCLFVCSAIVWFQFHVKAAGQCLASPGDIDVCRLGYKSNFRKTFENTISCHGATMLSGTTTKAAIKRMDPCAPLSGVSGWAKPFEYHTQ